MLLIVTDGLTTCVEVILFLFLFKCTYLHATVINNHAFKLDLWVKFGNFFACLQEQSISFLPVIHNEMDRRCYHPSEELDKIEVMTREMFELVTKIDALLLYSNCNTDTYQQLTPDNLNPRQLEPSVNSKKFSFPFRSFSI